MVKHELVVVVGSITLFVCGSFVIGITLVGVTLVVCGTFVGEMLVVG